MVAWADPYQRQSRRLQQRLAVEAASMPVVHVAALHGLSWLTVHRAEERALARWEATCPTRPLRHVGVDEKWLGRRHHLAHKYVTIVSDLETGEPVDRPWPKRSDAAGLARKPVARAAKHHQALRHGPAPGLLERGRRRSGPRARSVVHDPFHIMKLAGAMLDELRREVFFRAGPRVARPSARDAAGSCSAPGSARVKTSAPT
ncbi:MAG: transposase [Myxococcales bacterium]|nr:transposase [Myxococcales bacterium]